MKNRQWLLARRPQGAIQDRDFNLVEVDAPTPGEGEVLVRNLMLSCDPTQRGWIASTHICRRSRSARLSARSARAGSWRRTIPASRSATSCQVSPAGRTMSR